MTVWLWLSKERRKDVIKMSLEHAERVLGVAECAVKVLEAYLANNPSEASNWWDKVFTLEREADDTKRRILLELSKEVFHPIDRETIVRLIFALDDIAAYAKAWSRRTMLLFELGERLPETIISKLVLMGRRVSDATRVVREAIEKLAEEPKKVLELADDIERSEEEVDDIRIDVFRDIVHLCDKTRTSLCLLSKEIMDSIENGADKCEDVADVLRSLSLLSI
ncbi:MAG: DUF47 family protein [Thermofilum sp.]|nr:DUF47 family protein [Thermofilum sp.]